eukprot:Sspe_Gene.89772::Locus_61450_Transcript_1_1_Confidence_1.000_Length_577::g.89772::m.89772
MVCSSNLAACHLKLSQWRSAKVAAREALKFDDSNEKALYRYAEALFHLKDDDDEALACLEKVPLSPEARSLKEELLRRKKAGQRKLGAKLKQWTHELGECRRAVRFEDRETKKRVELLKARKGVYYELNGTAREPDTSAVYDAGAHTLRFPTIGKRLNLPHSPPSLLAGPHPSRRTQVTLSQTYAICWTKL